MNVYVHSGLPCGLPNIYADVESIGRMLSKCTLPGATKELKNRDLLLVRHFEEVGHVTLWNNENMPKTQRVVVQAHIRQSVLGQD